MLKNWLKMKKNELLVKNMVYKLILAFANEQKVLFEVLKKSYAAMKDVSADDLRSELIKYIAELAHSQAVTERESNNLSS